MAHNIKREAGLHVIQQKSNVLGFKFNNFCNFIFVFVSGSKSNIYKIQANLSIKGISI